MFNPRRFNRTFWAASGVVTHRTRRVFQVIERRDLLLGPAILRMRTSNADAARQRPVRVTLAVLLPFTATQKHRRSLATVVHLGQQPGSQKRDRIQAPRSSLHRVSRIRSAMPNPTAAIRTIKKSKITAWCLTWVRARARRRRRFPGAEPVPWRPSTRAGHPARSRARIGPRPDG